MKLFMIITKYDNKHLIIANSINDAKYIFSENFPALVDGYEISSAIPIKRGIIEPVLGWSFNR